MINVPFRGRELKVAGERTFENWVVTVINDEDFKLRTAFEKWSQRFDRLKDNTGVTEPSSYMADAYVHQLGRGRESLPIRTLVVRSVFLELTGSMTSGP